MRAIVNYNKIKELLPKQVSDLTTDLLSKIDKSKVKSKLSLRPADWIWYYNWGKKIQAYSFSEVMSGIQEKSNEPTSLEEELETLFKDGSISIFLFVSVGKLKSFKNFPSYKDVDFYIPEEVVDAYDNKKVEVLDKPTIFVYIKDKNGERLEEQYVLGALRDLKSNKDLIVLKGSGNLVFAYEIDNSSNNLHAKLNISLNGKFNVESFNKEHEVKLNKKEYKVLPVEQIINSLGEKSKWIQNESSYVDVLLSELSKSSSFMSIGNIHKKADITQIPEDTYIHYIEKNTDRELRKKLKIR